MKIKTKLNKFTIDDYIKSCGLEEINGRQPCEYSHPDWTFIEDMDRVAIVQDSDMDGVMSAAIAYQCVKKLNPHVDVLWHNGKQHGIHDMVDKLIGYDMVIIPDAGSMDSDDALILKQHGTRFIVALDHHEYTKDDRKIMTIYNCKDWDWGNNLSGACVTEICMGDDSSYIDLAACSIVSDVMPLNDIYNRWYIKNGLKNITNPFLKYLVDKLNKGVKPTPKWVAWTLAPLVNAVCRSDNQDAKELMFKAFVNEADFDKTLAIMRKCKRDQDANVKAVLDEIEMDNSHKFFVAFGNDNTKAYSGLVAGKLQGQYGKPTLVLRELNSTQYSGSMRSPIPMLSNINETGLAKCQGHETACGVMVNKSQLPRLLQWADNLDIDMSPEIEVACELSPTDINMTLCEQIQEHNALWGHGIEEPLFYSHIVAKKDDIQIFRKTSNTLRINAGDISFIKFRISDEDAEAIESHGNTAFDITYHLVINEYNGARYCQGMIDNIEFHDTSTTDEFDWDKIFG